MLEVQEQDALLDDELTDAVTQTRRHPQQYDEDVEPTEEQHRGSFQHQPRIGPMLPMLEREEDAPSHLARGSGLWPTSRHRPESSRVGEVLSKEDFLRELQWNEELQDGVFDALDENGDGLTDRKFLRVTSPTRVDVPSVYQSDDPLMLSAAEREETVVLEQGGAGHDSERSVKHDSERSVKLVAFDQTDRTNTKTASQYSLDAAGWDDTKEEGEIWDLALKMVKSAHDVMALATKWASGKNHGPALILNDVLDFLDVLLGLRAKPDRLKNVLDQHLHDKVDQHQIDCDSLRKILQQAEKALGENDKRVSRKRSKLEAAVKDASKNLDKAESDFQAKLAQESGDALTYYIQAPDVYKAAKVHLGADGPLTKFMDTVDSAGRMTDQQRMAFAVLAYYSKLAVPFVRKFKGNEDLGQLELTFGGKFDATQPLKVETLSKVEETWRKEKGLALDKKVDVVSTGNVLTITGPYHVLDQNWGQVCTDPPSFDKGAIQIEEEDIKEAWKKDRATPPKDITADMWRDLAARLAGAICSFAQPPKFDNFEQYEQHKADSRLLSSDVQNAAQYHLRMVCRHRGNAIVQTLTRPRKEDGEAVSVDDQACKDFPPSCAFGIMPAVTLTGLSHKWVAVRWDATQWFVVDVQNDGMGRDEQWPKNLRTILGDEAVPKEDTTGYQRTGSTATFLQVNDQRLTSSQRPPDVWRMSEKMLEARGLKTDGPVDGKGCRAKAMHPDDGLPMDPFPGYDDASLARTGFYEVVPNAEQCVDGTTTVRLTTKGKEMLTMWANTPWSGADRLAAYVAEVLPAVLEKDVASLVIDELYETKVTDEQLNAVFGRTADALGVRLDSRGLEDEAQKKERDKFALVIKVAAKLKPLMTDLTSDTVQRLFEGQQRLGSKPTDAELEDAGLSAAKNEHDGRLEALKAWKTFCLEGGRTFPAAIAKDTKGVITAEKKNLHPIFAFLQKPFDKLRTKLK